MDLARMRYRTESISWEILLEFFLSKDKKKIRKHEKVKWKGILYRISNLYLYEAIE